MSDKFTSSKQSFNRCCNPFLIKGHFIKTSLRKVTKQAVAYMCTLTANDRICTECRKYLYALIAKDNAPSIIGDPIDNVAMEVDMDSDSDSVNVYGDHYNLLQDVLLAENPLDLIDTLPKLFILDAVKFFHSIVHLINNDLVLKVQKTQLLTLFSLTMGVPEVKKYLDVSEYSIIQSQHLQRKKGILALPDPKKGKELPKSLVDFIIKFYTKPEISSERAGVKEVVRVKLDDGTKAVLRKRLLHWNLKEAFQLLILALQEEPDINHHIGFTKFTLLRPKNVMLVGASGTHNVCVCAIHQNVKLLIVGSHLASLTKNERIHIESYRNCFSLLMCENPTENCFFLNCDKCPGKQNLIDYLMDVFEKNEIETVSAKQWTTNNNKTTLETLQYDYDVFIEKFADQLENLLGHAYVADQQLEFSKKIENELKDGEFKVVCDFAENYSYVVQDAIQGFHWNNDQATIYNVVIYYRVNGQLHHRSLVIVSENRKHDAVSVYTFTNIIVDYLKKEFSSVKKIYYFSDGAPQQYKNYKNVINLAYHKEDFGIDAEWHYYPTSHGKGPCDGLGASVKHGIRSYCLQSKGEHQIVNIDDLFGWLCKTKRFPNVVFKRSPTADYNKYEKFLNRRFQSKNRVEHLQEQHCLIPVENGMIRAKRFSNSALYSDQKIL